MKLVLCTLIMFGLSTQAIAAKTLRTMAIPNSDMQKVLGELAGKNPKPIETLTALEARQQPSPADAVVSFMAAHGKKPDSSGFAKVQDIKVDGAVGQIPARLYVPDAKGPLPVVAYYHGGGFVIADLNTYDSSARAIAKDAKAIVVSVAYRLAPENKFPAAHDDAYAAYKWVVAHAKEIGGDPKRIAVAGESAGGNLAINVAIKARDEGFQAPVSELLVYPVAGSDMNTASYQENATAKPLSKAMMEWFVKNYLVSMDQASDPRINVVAANLKGLPPTTIITAQIDPLRTDGEELAEKLKAAGVKVDSKNFNGVTHEFFGMAPLVGEAASAQKFATAGLKKYF